MRTNAGDYDHRTALHIAASEGHVEIIKYLLSRHAEVNCCDRTGGTPLSDAIRHKQRLAQEILREAGATVQHDDDAAAELCRLAAEGELDQLRILVDNGLNANLGDYDSRRALHLACCEERLAVVEYLLSLPGIEVNVVDRFGGTPLEDAIREGRHTVANLLERHGAVRAFHPALQDKYDMLKSIADVRKKKRHKQETAQESEHAAVAKLGDLLRKIVTPLSTCNKKMLEQLQALIINANPKQRRSRKAIEHCPRLTAEDVCSDFFLPAFRRYMKHEEHAEHLLDCYLACLNFIKAPTFESLEALLTNYIGKSARRGIITAPKFVEPLQTALDDRGKATPSSELLSDTFEELETCFQPFLSRFYKSSDFLDAIHSKVGQMWRITRLSKRAWSTADDMIVNVMKNLQDICRSEALPHIFGERSDRIAKLTTAIGIHLNMLESIKVRAIEICVTNKVLYERGQRRRRILGNNEAADASGATGI